MTAPTSTAGPGVSRSEVAARPRFEGSNICTWIGFKHVIYLMEEAVLEHLRGQGLGPGSLYEQHGLGVEIVRSDTRILTALHMDDLVRTSVVQQPPGVARELVFRTESLVDRPDHDGQPVKAAAADVRVLFRLDDGGTAPPAAAPYTVARIDRGPAIPAPAQVTGWLADPAGAPGKGTGRGTIEEMTRPGPLTAGANGIVWRWRIPYFYCHYSRRLQHSGYLRLLEEVVDLFLASRGISIRDMVDERSWIPVVPRARVEIVREALMEEELHVVFTVENIFKNLTYDARMDCYVRRGDRFVHTATGHITHGYAAILNRREWKLMPFDERTIGALRGPA